MSRDFSRPNRNLATRVLLTLLPCVTFAVLAVPSAVSAGVVKNLTGTKARITLEGVTCVSVTQCFVVGGVTNSPPGTTTSADEILETTDSGSTWNLEAPPSVNGALDSISCPSPTTCFAGGWQATGSQPEANQIVETTDGGASWNEISLPTATSRFGIGSIDCTSDSTCLAVEGSNNTYYATTDGGVDWTVGAVVGGSSESTEFAFYTLTCPTSSMCFVSGSGEGAFVFETTDNGSSWSQVGPIGQYDYAYGMACSSAADCYLAISGYSDDSVLATTNDFATWTIQQAPGWSSEYLSCPSTSTCYMTMRGYKDLKITGSVDKTQDAGSKWHYHGATYDRLLSAIDCASTTLCFALPFDFTRGSGKIDTTDNGGKTWTVEDVPTPSS